MTTSPSVPDNSPEKYGHINSSSTYQYPDHLYPSSTFVGPGKIISSLDLCTFSSNVRMMSSGFVAFTVSPISNLIVYTQGLQAP